MGIVEKIKKYSFKGTISRRVIAAAVNCTGSAQLKPKKIVLFGYFGRGNLGNECTLQTMIFYVRKYLPDAEINCICVGPEDISTRYNIPALPISWTSRNVSHGQRNLLMRILRGVFIRIPMELVSWVKAFKTLKGIDMLIVAGTNPITNIGSGALSWPYEIFKWSTIAELRRCKELFVSIGVGPIGTPSSRWFLQSGLGPIDTPLSRWFFKSALSSAAYRSYRDSYSKQYLEGIGFRANSDLVYPDLAFSLPRTMLPACNHHCRERFVVGVGLMDYYGKDTINERKKTVYLDYINKTCSFVTWLLKQGYTVMLLIGDVMCDNSVKHDLIKVIEAVGLKYRKEQLINEPISSVEQLLAQLATTDLVVTPRFHNVLLAMLVNKPVLSISYHEKTASLMAGMGLAEYCQDIDQLDVGRLIEQFIKLQKNADNLRPQIKRRVEEFRKALDEQYNFIFKDV
jgi:polysaccharide pyruvyl transferase WcaK-like protein